MRDNPHQLFPLKVEITKKKSQQLQKRVPKNRVELHESGRN